MRWSASPKYSPSASVIVLSSSEPVCNLNISGLFDRKAIAVDDEDLGYSNIGRFCNGNALDEPGGGSMFSNNEP